MFKKIFLLIFVVVVLGLGDASEASPEIKEIPCALGECEKCVDDQWGSVGLCFPNYGCEVPENDPILCAYGCEGTQTDEGWKCCKRLKCDCGNGCEKASPNYSTCEELCSSEVSCGYDEIPPQ
jgi:hypothetical protein